MFAQSLSFTAIYDYKNSSAVFSWNMTDHAKPSTYILERSLDKKRWTTSVTDNRFQQYSHDDIFDFDERVEKDKMYYYRLSIIDKQHNILTRSEIFLVDTKTTKGGWRILQNPVASELVLTNNGAGSMGTINITVIDISGKPLIQYRAASIHTIIKIPVSNFKRGYYVVQLSVLNKILLTGKWLKQ